jgi:hypothetical protein
MIFGQSKGREIDERMQARADGHRVRRRLRVFDRHGESASSDRQALGVPEDGRSIASRTRHR